MRSLKILSAAAAITMILCSVPFSAAADDAENGTDTAVQTETTVDTAETLDSVEDIIEPIAEPVAEPITESETVEPIKTSKQTGGEISYRMTADGKAVITAVDTKEKSFTIPAVITDNGASVRVSGIDDFAFAECEELTSIGVPATLTLEDTGNAAFITGASFRNFMNNELGSAATIGDLLRYIALKANYNNGNYTEEDLEILFVKLVNKFSDVDISRADTLEGKLMILVRSVRKIHFDPKLRNLFELWLASITYDGLTICGQENIPMQSYAQAREFLGMKYKAVNNYVLGDANGDGKVNVIDAVYIASQLSKRIKLDVAITPGTDFNKDGKINIIDALAIARALAAGTLR